MSERGGKRTFAWYHGMHWAGRGAGKVKVVAVVAILVGLIIFSGVFGFLATRWPIFGNDWFATFLIVVPALILLETALFGRSKKEGKPGDSD